MTIVPFMAPLAEHAVARAVHQQHESGFLCARQGTTTVLLLVLSAPFHN